ncbi:hypothetical protein DFP72DRAFT_1171189 [Ephemerocybe angulata]|uniref:MYND-type domain-containing protein n=1 Tax=Ephemerocybe angulata TaxID=980116 RepID=A0A8H6HTP5_9AGAR|nr:hypothetical protein DFP72DRAFT_1171189 [Tulosesus angulatus]
MSGLEFLSKAQVALVVENDRKKAFDLYQKAIKRIMERENPLTLVSAQRTPSMTDDVPSEALAFAFLSFSASFRDPTTNFTEATVPEAFKLLSSFRPNSQNKDLKGPRFASPRAQFLLKCLQISALLTLGLLAWDAKDRAKAAKRYKEALELAASEPRLTTRTPAVGLETWIAHEVREIRDNLEILVRNDEENAEVLRRMGVQGGNTRKEEVRVPNVRVEAGGAVRQEWSTVSATDACGRCGVRDVKLEKCARCKKMKYCGKKCQTEDWKSHKANCIPAA